MGRKRRTKRKSRRKKEAKERVEERRAKRRPSPAKARLALWIFALVVIIILAIFIIKLNRPDDENGNGNGNGNGNNNPPANRIPIPGTFVNATTPYTYELIQFDGSSSKDLDGYIVNFTWDFHRDWLTGEVVFSKYGRKFNISFNESGTWYIVLKVTDNEGATNTTVSFNKYWGITLQVMNRPPVAIIDGGDQTVKVGQEVYLYGDDSYDKDDTVLTYHWDFGDGNTSTDVITQHKYESAGEYTITLTVDDGEDETTDKIKVVVT